MAFTLFWRRKIAGRSGAMWEREHTQPRIVAIIAGRRHVTGVPYALPKDPAEVSHLDFQHYIYRSLLRGNFLAPLSSDVVAILDVAAGTSVWGKEMVKRFPFAKVIGLDIENIKDSSQLTPQNYEFIKGNLLERLPFEDNTFDFVHQSLVLASAVPFSLWSQVFAELLRVMRPGGWLELAEVGVEGTNIGQLTRNFFQWGMESGLSRGLYPRERPNILNHLLGAAGQQIKMKYYDVPLGSWGGRIGTMMETNIVSAFQGLKALYLERANGEEFDSLLRRLPDEWKSLRTHIRFFVFLCRK